MALVESFEGLFSVWSYSIGHSRLLLRRTKKTSGTSLFTEHDTRINVVFGNIKYISIPASFDGLQIFDIEDKKSLPNFRPLYKGEHLYRLNSAEFSGVIVASYVLWDEDSGEYDDPTPLLQ